MKIFSPAQIREADKFTTEKQNISSDALMERAGYSVFNWIHSRLQDAKVKIHIFCGVGNNGGDGLVISRHLVNQGYDIAAHIVNFSENRSKDFLLNLDRLKESKHWPSLINCIDDFPKIEREDIVIDAIFGIGLNRSPEGCTSDLIAYINKSNAFTLSVDIPSGLSHSFAPSHEDAAIKANYVLSFQTPKMVFFLPQTGIYCNQWEVLDIGIDPSFIAETRGEALLIQKQDILHLYIPRTKFSHKGNYGHALLIGGSYGKIGAPVLAAKASLKSGAGLVSIYLPKCGYIAAQSAFPEAMVITSEDEEKITTINYDIKPKAIGIGPGIGTDKATLHAFKKFLEACVLPMVIDADAINMLALDSALLKLIPSKSVLTPHPGELKRLIGNWKDDFDKLNKAKAFVKQYDVILAIKGAHTMILHDDDIFINDTGNPGMATAGSGDVLTGIITGLITQGYDPLNATIFGVYLHGKAGDIGILKMGYQALIASDIIDYLGDAIMDLFQQEHVTNNEEHTESNNN